jgi:acyl-CoA reductase-like NAD-dependent aldehyde dehydrogenase
VTSTSSILNPATEQLVGTVPRLTAAETDRAIDRAAVAWPTWSAVAPADGARVLRRVAAAIDAARDELAVGSRS